MSLLKIEIAILYRSGEDRIVTLRYSRVTKSSLMKKT